MSCSPKQVLIKPLLCELHSFTYMYTCKYIQLSFFFLQKAAQVSSDIFVKYFKKQIMEIVDDEKVCYCRNNLLKNFWVAVLVAQAVIDKHSVNLMLITRTTAVHVSCLN